MTASHYWLAQWLDENEIHSEWEIDHALNSESCFNNLLETIFKVSQEPRAIPPPSELNDSIVAGRKLDLSGVASCPVYECLREGIDSTFKRVWHYFDQIVVEGISPGWLAEDIRTSDKNNFPFIMRRIHDQARLILYLRETGAEQFVIFAPKSHAFCHEHWQQHARDLGLAAAVDDSQHDKLVKKIIKTSKFDIKKGRLNRWRVTVTGKYFDEPETGLFFFPKGKNDPPTYDEIVCSIISNRATAMISDVSLSRQLSLPLFEPTGLPWISQPYRDNRKSAENSAVIRIGLPVFDNLTTRDFLTLREDERPEFEAFRAALRRAIQTQVAENPSRSPGDMARSIESEYLRPGLADIERQIKRRRSAMIKKTSVNLAIGTSAAAIGAITSMPLLVEGIAALGSAIPLAPIMHKFIDDGESIKMSELYFLWQAKKKGGHH
jgi:hypothetical protein